MNQKEVRGGHLDTAVESTETAATESADGEKYELGRDAKAFAASLR